MTTGRINQVTVLRARSPEGAARGSGYRGLRPFPGQSLVTDRSSRPSVAATARRLALSGDPPDRSDNKSS